MARTKGTKVVGAEVSAGLLDQFRLFCEQRGESLRRHLEWAMQRHMAAPPPPPVAVELPPLPAVSATPATTTTAPTSGKGKPLRRGRKGKR
jgi:hypothetical protein